MTAQYLETLEHYINGAWVQPTSGKTQDVINPSTSISLGKLGHASKADLERALAAAAAGFNTWRRVSAFERCKIMRKAADLLRSRVDQIANVLSLEQGKLLAEAKLEILASADVIDWFAEEGRRAYGRVIPARADGVRNMVIMEPVGPVAGFSPWNFPVLQAARKIGGALGGGLLDHHQVPGRNAGVADRVRQVLPRRRRPAGRHQSRLRQSGRNLRVPDSIPGHSQDFLHRLRCRSASSSARSPVCT